MRTTQFITRFLISKQSHLSFSQAIRPYPLSLRVIPKPRLVSRYFPGGLHPNKSNASVLQGPTSSSTTGLVISFSFPLTCFELSPVLPRVVSKLNVRLSGLAPVRSGSVFLIRAARPDPDLVPEPEATIHPWPVSSLIAPPIASCWATSSIGI